MYKGTTHLLILVVEDVDLDGCTVSVDFMTLTGEMLRKTEPDITVAGSEIAIFLTQEDTLRIPEGPVRTQVRWADRDNAFVTDMGYVDVHGIMTDYVIEHGGDSL